MNNLLQENSENLVDGKYSITDLIDLKRLQSIFDKFTLASGFTIGFLDHPGLNVIASSGWRNMCTKFHRNSDASLELCIKSNRKLLQSLNQPNQPIVEECEHGLIDCAIPIFIKGKHIASLATGQLLFEKPDIERFKKQAKTFGYDEETYLAALKEIPIIPKDGLHNVTSFMGEMATLISEMGYANLLIKEESEKLEKEIAEQKRLKKELIESETRYAALFNGTVEGILAVDTETKRIVFGNPAICNMLGYSEEELTNLGIEDIHPAESMEYVFNSFDNLAQNKTTKQIDIPCLKKDGSVIYTDVTANSIIINNTHLTVGFFTEITERRKAEYAAEESELRYKILFQTSPSGILVLDENGFILEANQEIFRSTIYPPDELIGQHIIKLSSADNLPEVKKNIERLLSGEILEEEVTNVSKDGSPRIFMLRESAITLPNNERRILSVSTDITERKMAEIALSASEQYSRLMVENSPFAAHHYKLNDDNQLIFVGANPAADKILGVDNQQYIGKTIEEAFPPLAKTDIPEMYRRVAAIGESYDNEQLDYEDEQIRGAFEVHAFQTSQNNMTAFFSDITHRKVAERLLKQKAEEIQSQNEEYKKINIELKQAIEKAEESDRLKSAFLANMSHEIRTPMNGILNFVKILKETNISGEKQQEYIRIIEKSGDRLLGIINDLISISKIEAGLMEIVITETNVNETIEHLYSLFKQEIEKKGIHLSIKNSVPSKESVISTDSEKLYIVLTNLIKNAIKFTRKGSIEFGYEKKDGYFEFFVKDTGAGIPDEQKEFIFERFRQGSESLSRSYEGAGLGLSITKSYVEMLGGKIWLESDTELGTIFYFTIPNEEKPSLKNDSENNLSGENNQTRIKCLNILIAEDDEASDMYLTIALSKYTKEVFHAKTGDEAIEISRNHPEIDLVLMDIKMAEMDGYEATRQIRTFNQDVTIIAQTAYGIAGDREKAINAGCNEHISKPITTGILMEILEKFFFQ